MKLAYTGPKPIISHTGIEFDLRKEDKYHYLAFAIQLLKALDHEYIEDRTYRFEPEMHRYSDDELLTILRRYAPEAEAEARQRADRLKRDIDAEIAEARQHALLNAAEREALVNNLKLMSDYRLQRSINKSLYYSAVDALASLIARGHIYYIKVPFRQEYFHVFHTVEGVLKKMKKTFDTQIEIYEENERLMVRLDVASR